MKLTIHPVRQMTKGKVKVWRDCEVVGAHAFEVRHGKTLKRRVPTKAEAERIVLLFAKPKKPIDRRSLIGKRWSDVKDKL